MDSQAARTPSRWSGAIAIICFLGLLFWQGWLTLRSFGGDRPWERMTNSEPVASGYHPLHQYHGMLGARTLLQNGRCCSYDPAFQLGYPKTPVFDNGSRPAELFLLFAGGRFNPAAYKIGLAVVCLLAPMLLFVTARGVGVGLWGSVLATGMGHFVWWGGPAQAAWHRGEVDLLLGGLLLAALIGALVRFDRRPGILAWLAMLISASLGWFIHPLLFAVFVPLLLLYYLYAGVRHGSWWWHIALFAGQTAAIGINALWLYDWIGHWWIQVPLATNPDLLPQRTLRTIWEAPLWGGDFDRIFVLAVFGCALIGISIMDRRKHRTAARLLGLGTCGLLLLATFGISLEFWGRIGSEGLFIPALWFAVVAAGYGLMEILKALARLIPMRWPRAAMAALLIGVTLFWGEEHLLQTPTRFGSVKELQIGLTADQRKIVRLLTEKTTPLARVLWEDRQGNPATSRWTALLPVLTNRHFIGGLDPTGRIEHSHTGFVRKKLAGRPIAHWSDEALEKYCRLYNIGWVVVWSPVCRKRLEKWPAAKPVSILQDEDEGDLFQIERKAPSFVLHGRASLIKNDNQHISLANVKPANGKVVLSFHYQPGLHASPSRVKLEPEPDPITRIPLVRLRVDQPVSRVTLMWKTR